MIEWHKLVILSAIFFTAAISSCAYAIELMQLKNITPIEVFEKLKTLEGTHYEIDADGRPARVDYEIVARGSVLTETWIMTDGLKEITVFHMNNGELMATHYCAANIQSTMTLKSVPSSETREYVFVLDAVSNLAAPDLSHNSGFGYTFVDENTVVRTEKWTKSGEDSISELTLLRDSR